MLDVHVQGSKDIAFWKLFEFDSAHLIERGPQSALEEFPIKYAFMSDIDQLVHKNSEMNEKYPHIEKKYPHIQVNNLLQRKRQH